MLFGTVFWYGTTIIQYNTININDVGLSCIMMGVKKAREIP